MGRARGGDAAARPATLSLATTLLGSGGTGVTPVRRRS